MRALRRILGAASIGVLVLALASCGDGGGGTSQSPSKKPSPTTTKTTSGAPPKPSGDTPPKAGTVLAQIDAPGRLNVVTNGNGFLIVQSVVGADPDPSTITAYDARGTQLAKLRAPSFSSDCGAADVVVDGRRLILTEKALSKPAQGIKPARSSLELDAWDAQSGARQWTTTIVPESVGFPGCALNEDGKLEGVATTRDGRWALYTNQHNFMDNEVVDLRSGKVRAYADAIAVLGNYTVEPTEDLSTADRGGIWLTDPSSGQRLGRIKDVDFDYKILDIAPSGMTESEDPSPSAPMTTADGQRVIAASGEAERITAFSLPDGKRVWSAPSSYDVTADGDGTLIAYRDALDEVEKGRTFVLDDKTGRQLWNLMPALGSVCGLTKSQLLASVNGQLTTLEPRSGKQLSYDSSSSDCPDVRPGGIGVASNDDLTPGVIHDVTVTQVLVP